MPIRSRILPVGKRRGEGVDADARRGPASADVPKLRWAWPPSSHKLNVGGLSIFCAGVAGSTG